MLIYNNSVVNIKKRNIIFQKQKDDNVTKTSKSFHKNAQSLLSSLQAAAEYNRMLLPLSALSKRNSKLINSKIPNLSQIGPNEYRGEALSSPKNRKFLNKISLCGVKTIIDLRDKFNSKDYPSLCEKFNINYVNIPIDASSVPTRQIVDSLPELFEKINSGNFYIHCAQGLHRTDIALALNYVFNPKSDNPPVLPGHYRNGEFKFEDISRRLNSVKNALTEEDMRKIGLKSEDFDKTFKNRKKELIEYNKKVFNS